MDGHRDKMWPHPKHLVTVTVRSAHDGPGGSTEQPRAFTALLYMHVLCPFALALKRYCYTCK